MKVSCNLNLDPISVSTGFTSLQTKTRTNINKIYKYRNTEINEFIKYKKADMK